jgi:hypothetical protein
LFGVGTLTIPIFVQFHLIYSKHSAPDLTNNLLQVTTAPQGAQAATLDVEGAYRTTPVKLDHKRYLIVHFDGGFYINHNTPFGLASASGLQGEVTDATINIWEYHEISPAVKWVDDFNVFHFPKPHGTFLGISDGVIHSYGYDLTSIKSLIAPLGIPWHKNKGQEFSDTFSYLGFHWDLLNKTVSLLDHKRDKYFRKVSSLISACESSQVLKPQVKSVIGTLSHITFVHCQGRSYMSNLYKWLASFLSNYIPRWISSLALSDLRWWSSLKDPLSPFPHPSWTYPRLQHMGQHVH